MKIYREGDFIISELRGKRRFQPWGKLELIDHGDGRGSAVLDPSNAGLITETFDVIDIVNKKGEPYGATIDDFARGISTGIDVNIQDQITPPLDSLFVESISTFELTTDIVASGITMLVYEFEAVAGHMIATGNEIILLDTLGDRSLQAVVILVDGNVITLDRPIDHAYTAAATLGRITNSNMAVAGSLSTPRIFTLRGGLNPSDFTRFLLTMTDASPMDDGLFGGMDRLTNGLVFRIVSDFQRTIFNFKTNEDIKLFCHNLTYAPKAPSGLYGASARMSFNGNDKHGVPLRVSNLQVIQWIVQDDVTELLTMKSVGQGQETKDE